MGSLNNWLNIPQQEREDLAFVVEDGQLKVDVFRRDKQAGVAGLTAETEDQDYLRTANVRIDNHYSRSATGEVTNKPTALTDDQDVRRDDLWRLTHDTLGVRWYRVSDVTRTAAVTSVALQEVKR